jgi:hypothetical protein
LIGKTINIVGSAREMGELRRGSGGASTRVGTRDGDNPTMGAGR